MNKVEAYTRIWIVLLGAALVVACSAATAPPTNSTPTAPLPSTVVDSGPSAATAAKASVTPAGGDQVSPGTVPPNLVEQARADLARRLNLPAESFQLKQAEAVEWRDASLGCPKPGLMYAQVITPGYRIVLGANEQEYEYHTDGRRVSFCEK